MKKAVTGILNLDGLILVGKKRVDSNKFLSDCWHIPGETKQGLEHDLVALKRGYREETGLEIGVETYLAEHFTPRGGTKVTWYECSALTTNAIPRDDLVEIRWIPREYVKFLCGEYVVSFWPDEIKQYFGIQTNL